MSQAFWYYKLVFKYNLTIHLQSHNFLISFMFWVNGHSFSLKFWVHLWVVTTVWSWNLILLWDMLKIVRNVNFQNPDLAISLSFETFPWMPFQYIYLLFIEIKGYLLRLNNLFELSSYSCTITLETETIRNIYLFASIGFVMQSKGLLGLRNCFFCFH